MAGKTSVKRLIEHGITHHDELFGAQYGEWPLRGMIKDTPREGKITIQGMLSDRKPKLLSYVFELSYAKYDPKTDESQIYLNKALMHPAGRIFGLLATRQAFIRIQDIVNVTGIVSPLIAFELAASVVGSSYRYAVLSSIVKMINPSASTITGEEQIHCLQLADPDDVPITEAFHNCAKDIQENQASIRRGITYTMQVIDMLLTLMPMAYYAADTELQARLHNILVKGYPAWGKLPENDEELYAALLDMGIKAPTGMEQLFRDNPELNKISEPFRKHKSFELGHLNPPNAEMNIGLNSYRDGGVSKTGEILAMYWGDCLPYLYADLLKKYGDSTALSRFGYDGERDIVGIPVRTNKP